AERYGDASVEVQEADRVSLGYARCGRRRAPLRRRRRRQRKSDGPRGGRRIPRGQSTPARGGMDCSRGRAGGKKNQLGPGGACKSRRRVRHLRFPLASGTLIRPYAGGNTRRRVTVDFTTYEVCCKQILTSPGGHSGV